MNNWLSLKKEELEEFCLIYEEKDYNIDNPQTNSSLGNPITTPNYNPVQQFSKSIKKDIKVFPKIKDSKQWDS